MRERGVAGNGDGRGTLKLGWRGAAPCRASSPHPPPTPQKVCDLLIPSQVCHV